MLIISACVESPATSCHLNWPFALLPAISRKEFHGFEIAKLLQAVGDSRLLTAYGTLYRALGRLEDMGLLTSHAEDPAIPAREGRPGRRRTR